MQHLLGIHYTSENIYNVDILKGTILPILQLQLFGIGLLFGKKCHDRMKPLVTFTGRLEHERHLNQAQCIDLECTYWQFSDRIAQKSILRSKDLAKAQWGNG